MVARATFQFFTATVPVTSPSPLVEAAGSGAIPVAVTVGDFNGDTWPDIASGNFNSGGNGDVSIFIANASGLSFAAPVSVGTGAGSPQALVAEYFNADANTDIATANDNGDVSILLGDGTGAFSPAATSPESIDPTGASVPYGIAVQDVNNDGVIDLATANLNVSGANANGGLSILLGTPGDSGDLILTATSPVDLGSSMPFPSSLAVADFSGDGNQDVAIADANWNDVDPDVASGKVAILLGDGNSAFSPAASSPINTGADGALALATADFDSNSSPDLTVANNSNFAANSVSVLLNQTTVVPPTNDAISINDAIVTEGNPPGQTTATFTVTLANPTATQPVTVSYTTNDGTATQPSDYDSNSGTVTFAPGETSQPVTVQVNRDLANESDETFTVDLSNQSANATIIDAQGLGWIINDDSVPAISINDATVTEGNPPGQTAANFTVSLASPSAEQVTVNFATNFGSAIPPSDYDSSSGTVTFAPGETSQPVTVQVNRDLTFEPNETFTVDLTNPSLNATVADAQGLGTITNDDPAPTVSINDVARIELDPPSLMAANFTATLSNPSSQTVTVNYATSDGTATLTNNDYFFDPTGTVTFAPGQTSKLVSPGISQPGPLIRGDNNDEADETFNVDLSNAVNASISDGHGVATILNDDTPISINDATVAEGDVGATNADFTITLAHTSTLPVTVHYATANDSATQPGDYTAISGDVTFDPGQTSKPVTVEVNGDTTDEIDETYNVFLSATVNGKISDGQGVGTITDDDPPPTVSINDLTLAEGNAGQTNADFTVTLSAASGKTVAIDYATSDGTATLANNDYAATNSTVTFAPGQTSKPATVPINGDTTLESDETFNVDLANAVNLTINDAQGVGTITNDDSAPSAAAGTIEGTAGDDVLEGTSGDDVINCGAGNDIAYGRGGNDVINCGAGNDTVYGGAGNDTLNGDSSPAGTAIARAAGTGGNDTLKGGAGNDKLNGQGGNDKLKGKGGNDRLNGGPGKDSLIGGQGRDKLRGGPGRDRQKQ